MYTGFGSLRPSTVGLGVGNCGGAFLFFLSDEREPQVSLLIVHLFVLLFPIRIRILVRPTMTRIRNLSELTWPSI